MESTDDESIVTHVFASVFQIVLPITQRAPAGARLPRNDGSRGTAGRLLFVTGVLSHSSTRSVRRRPAGGDTRHGSGCSVRWRSLRGTPSQCDLHHRGRSHWHNLAASTPTGRSPRHRRVRRYRRCRASRPVRSLPTELARWTQGTVPVAVAFVHVLWRRRPHLTGGLRNRPVLTVDRVELPHDTVVVVACPPGLGGRARRTVWSLPVQDGGPLVESVRRSCTQRIRAGALPGTIDGTV